MKLTEEMLKLIPEVIPYPFDYDILLITTRPGGAIFRTGYVIRKIGNTINAVSH